MENILYKENGKVEVERDQQRRWSAAIISGAPAARRPIYKDFSFI